MQPMLSASLHSRQAMRILNDLSGALVIDDVHLVADIRRHNLERLILEAGSLVAVADRAATSSVYLSQLRHHSPDSRTGKARDMGGAMARRLERAFGKPIGWMDTAETSAREPARGYADRAPAPPPPPPANFEDRRMPADSEWQLLQDLRAMPAEDRERLMRDVHEQADRFRRHVREYLSRLNHDGDDS